MIFLKVQILFLNIFSNSLSILLLVFVELSILLTLTTAIQNQIWFAQSTNLYYCKSATSSNLLMMH